MSVSRERGLPMANIPILFSIVFFLVCTFYVFLGVYILKINSHGHINRVFFLLCISLSFWAFGFSISISASDMETCLSMRRVSALGWGSFFSILLHFILILTGKNNILKKWWIYVLLYLPSAVTIYVFALSNEKMLMEQYNFVYTSHGWINVSINNAWDWLSDIYYVCFTFVGVGLVWKWGRKSSSEQIKKQSRLFLFTFLGAFLLGTATDIISNSYFKTTIPQIAPIIIMIPAFAIYYSINQYKMMNPTPFNEDQLILNDASRTRTYNYLSISFVIGGFLNFISAYLLSENGNLQSALCFSALIIIIGLIIQIVERLKIDENFRDFFIATIIFFVIPAFTLKFIESASITVWAFPFIFIIIFLVFNKRIVFVAVTVSILLTQVIVWIIAPNATVKVNVIDHTFRIGFFCIAIWLAFYVNKVYILRLKENADQISFQKLITEISSDFITVNQFNFDIKINNMLKQSGEFFQVDRTYAFIFNPEKHTMTYTHEWCNQGIESEIGTIKDVPLDVFPWWMNQIKSKGIVHIPVVESLPEEAGEEKQQLTRQKIQSLIALPILGKDKVLGFLGFESVKILKQWRDDHISLLKIIANILADALVKVDAEKEINFMAYYDLLTKLPNRLLFRDRVSQAIYLASRTEKMIGIIFLDLDSFKTVNDTMGHEGGDELLKKVAEEMLQCVRKSDTVSRFGGDEFLVMINNISNKEDILMILDKIMGIFNKPFKLKGQEFFISASAGIAVFPIDGKDTETLIKNADVAMYNAKDRGKNQCILCSEDMKEEVQKKMRLMNSLYRAQERNEFVLHYQPQISLQSGKIIGLEALLRWDHPEMGLILPGIFIPLAEQSGLINPIGEWVLKTACRQNKVWQDMGLPRIRMAINVSLNQFRNLITQISDVLNEVDLKPEYLELEITESVAVDETNYTIDVLNALKELGISVAIDDFGTKYSSLSRLKMLPIDRIKMDMQFVHGIEEKVKDKAIAKVIIQLAKNLGVKVMAEGVETEQQLKILSQMMCDEAQGYYYFKPMPAEEIEGVLRKSLFSDINMILT